MRRRALVALATAAVAVLPLAATLSNPLLASASSHREAPLISQDPTADNTDVYAFVSPDDQVTKCGKGNAPIGEAPVCQNGSITIVANYIPIEIPTAGPNFYRFGDDVKYTIHIATDTSADSTKSGIDLNFRFKTYTNDSSTFLYNTGVVKFNGNANHKKNYTNFNRPQLYSMQVVDNTNSTTCETTANTNNGALFTPPVNVGKTSTPNYANLADAAIQSGSALGRCEPMVKKVFAGQRTDPFFVDLGGVFDLLGVAQPFGAAGINALKGINVNTITVQIPVQKLIDAMPNKNHHVIGVWASASRDAVTTIHADGSRSGDGLAAIQVSRLGNPLVNEVVVPLAFKDFWNSQKPKDDGPNGFGPAVVKPILAAYMHAFFDKDIPTDNRTDLVATFLTGLKHTLNNQLGGAGSQTAADVLRLNWDNQKVNADPNKDSRFGAFAGEGGFPNGRRLADDVTDIALLAVAGILCDPAHNPTFGADTGQASPCRPSNVPTVIGDGVNASSTPFLTTFPYTANAQPGH